MILAATARLASKEGYATLTVPRVRAAAGVSRRSFDAHFDGVADCFLATLEMLSDRTLAAAAPFYLTAEDWASGVHRMIASLCRHLAGDPTFANLAFREVFSPGPEAIQWRSEMIAKLATMLRRGAPPEQQPSVFAAEASIGAMWGVIHHFVASGRGAQLPIAAPMLSYIALAPAIGGAAAVDAIVAPSVRSAQRSKRRVDRNHFCLNVCVALCGAGCSCVRRSGGCNARRRVAAALRRGAAGSRGPGPEGDHAPAPRSHPNKESRMSAFPKALASLQALKRLRSAQDSGDSTARPRRPSVIRISSSQIAVTGLALHGCFAVSRTGPSASGCYRGGTLSMQPATVLPVAAESEPEPKP